MRLNRIGAALVLLALAACDLPTSLPGWHIEVVTPGIEEEVALRDLLPASISEIDGAFLLSDITGSGTDITLASVCPTCVSAHGATVPLPAFSYTQQIDLSLPEDVRSAALDQATLRLTIHNGTAFTMLDDGSGSTGFLHLTVREADGTPIHTFLLDGAQHPLPSQGTDVVVFDFAEAVRDLRPGLYFEIEINSPGTSESQTLDINEMLTVSGSLEGIRISEILADVSPTTLDPEPFVFEMDPDVREQLVERVQTFTLSLEINNPLAISGDLHVDLAPGSFASAVRTHDVVVGPGLTTSILTLNQQELRAWLGGEDVVLRVQGDVSASNNILITPGLALKVRARIHATVRVN